MMNKEEYEKEIVRMWDSLRTDSENKGYYGCADVTCKKCPLKDIRCSKPVNAFKMIEAVEKWSKEHPPKKFKVSKLEYDIIRAAIDYSSEEEAFKDVDILYELLINGYFKGATRNMTIEEYLRNCEVVDDTDKR